MREGFASIVFCLVLGLPLVVFPRQIAAWVCGRLRELCRAPGNDWFARLCSGAVWIVKRVSLGWVHDVATAPRAFRFVGFLYLWIALTHWFVFFVL
jgi:hypothetical protein